jgi:predicted amidophosphoribosyltransferase
MSAAMPTETVVVLVGITVLSMVDAYWLATQANRTQQLDEPGAACPNCGKEIDPDIEFCHWCTTELQPTSDEGDEPSRA